MTGSPKYRMLALDVDGTIAGRDYRVPKRTIEAIHEAVAAGVLVSLVTGRMRRSALRYAAECGTNGPTISYQGGITTSPDGVTDIRRELLEPRLARSTLEEMRGSSAHINVYADDEIWVENRSEWAVEYTERMKTELRFVPDLNEVVANGPLVVMAVDEPPLITSLSGKLRAKLATQVAVTQSLPHFCEVASLLATKHTALARVCNDYGIDRSEVISVGDGEGDISMIEWAGLGIASGNASSRVAEVADIQIPGPDEHGVPVLIQNLLKQGKLGR